CTLRCPIVHFQREILEYEARIRFGGNQTLDGGLRSLACGTLQVSEFDDCDLCFFRTPLGPADALLQSLLRRIVGFGAERDNVAVDRVVSVRRDVQAAGLVTLPAGQ